MDLLQPQNLLQSWILFLGLFLPVSAMSTVETENEGGIFWCYVMPALMGISIITVFGCLMAACMQGSDVDDEDEDEKKND